MACCDALRALVQSQGAPTVEGSIACLQAEHDALQADEALSDWTFDTCVGALGEDASATTGTSSTLADCVYGSSIDPAELCVMKQGGFTPC